MFIPFIISLRIDFQVPICFIHTYISSITLTSFFSQFQHSMKESRISIYIKFSFGASKSVLEHVLALGKLATSCKLLLVLIYGWTTGRKWTENSDLRLEFLFILLLLFFFPTREKKHYSYVKTLVRNQTCSPSKLWHIKHYKYRYI